MPYTLPWDELVKLFSRSCNKPISQILRIQQHHTFEDALSQAKLIEVAKVQYGDIKMKKKDNNNQKYRNNGGNPSTSYQKPQNSQVSHDVHQTQPVVQLAPPRPPTTNPLMQTQTQER